MTGIPRRQQPLSPEQKARLDALWREQAAFLGEEEAAREIIRHDTFLRTLGHEWGNDEVLADARRVLAAETRKRAIAAALDADIDASLPN